MGQLYLHETLDPVRAPGAHTRYLDQLGEVVRTMGNAPGSAGGECIAAWAPVFLTGDWPRIVTFWEMPGGWDGFGRHFDGHNDLFHQPLERWYGERSGGFDRVLEGTEFTPSREQLAATGRRAPVVLQQIVTLRPGGADNYLAQLGDAKAGIDASCSFSLLGAFKTAFRNGSEIMVLWAFPDMTTLARSEHRAADFPAYAAWIERSRAQEITHTGLVLRPTSWSLLK
jgi:NIPSNAP protein